MQDLQALVYEESQTKVRLQMELDAKDSEIESLHRTVANFNSETASLSSGADNDIDELGQWFIIPLWTLVPYQYGMALEYKAIRFHSSKWTIKNEKHGRSRKILWIVLSMKEDKT